MYCSVLQLYVFAQKCHYQANIKQWAHLCLFLVILLLKQMGLFSAQFFFFLEGWSNPPTANVPAHSTKLLTYISYPNMKQHRKTQKWITIAAKDKCACQPYVRQTRPTRCRCHCVRVENCQRTEAHRARLVRRFFAPSLPVPVCSLLLSIRYRRYDLPIVPKNETITECTIPARRNAQQDMTNDLATVRCWANRSPCVPIRPWE